MPKKHRIDLADYGRRGLLEAFRDRQMPCFSTSCNLDITPIRRFIKANGYSFFITMSYVLSRAVNQVPEFRHRLIAGELYAFERVDPGYTVLLEDGTFSFCDSMHFDDFERYRKHAANRIASVKIRPDHDTGDKHHMFFISNVPWFSFTAFTHPYERKYGSIPILTIGKYFEQDNVTWMPLAVQVHHGVVDGSHVGLLYDHIGQLVRYPDSLHAGV